MSTIKVEDVELLEEKCRCYPLEEFSDNTEVYISGPQFYFSIDEARKRFKEAFHEYFNGKQYFAIHLNGHHVLTVHQKGFCFCTKCKLK